MKILLTTDGSKSAESAIRWFARLPIKHGGTYEVLTVSSYQVFGMVPAKVREEFVRLETIHASDSFARAAAILSETGLNAVHVTCFGQPADVITQYAKESSADLVVVGAHGQSTIEKMLIGSTSETVARHAPCPVLIVREANSKRSVDGQGIVVTVASDCSEADLQIASQINALSFAKNTQMQLVSVIQHPYLLEPTFEYDAHLTRQTTESMDRLARELAGSSDCIEKHVFEKIHVASCILHFLDNHPSDLIVLGDKGRSAIGRFFLGSVSRAVLHHAPCSVLLVKKKV